MRNICYIPIYVNVNFLTSQLDWKKNNDCLGECAYCIDIQSKRFDPLWIVETDNFSSRITQQTIVAGLSRL